MSALDDVLGRLGGEAAGWVGRNREHILALPRETVHTMLLAASQGRTLDAEIALYKELGPEQRRAYAHQSLEQLRTAVDARLRAVAVLRDALETLGQALASVLFGAFDELLGALLDAASEAASNLGSSSGGTAAGGAEPAGEGG